MYIEDRSVEQRRLVDAQKYQMMDHAVQPAHEDPLIVVENQRLLHACRPKTVNVDRGGSRDQLSPSLKILITPIRILYELQRPSRMDRAM